MTANKVHNRLIRLSQPGTYELFLGHLFRSTSDMPIRIRFIKDNGKQRYYKAFWDTSEYVGNQASQTKQMNGQYNLQVLELDGDWRTFNFTEILGWKWMGTFYDMK
jgi:hypothetical protein